MTVACLFRVFLLNPKISRFFLKKGKESCTKSLLNYERKTVEIRYNLLWTRSLEIFHFSNALERRLPRKLFFRFEKSLYFTFKTNHYFQGNLSKTPIKKYVFEIGKYCPIKTLGNMIKQKPVVT